MNRLPILAVAIVLWLLTFLVADAVFARSQSLTTTIIITVRSEPQSHLPPDDQNAALVEGLAEAQSITHPSIYLQEDRPRPTYTIIDKL